MWVLVHLHGAEVSGSVAECCPARVTEFQGQLRQQVVALGN